MSPTSTRPNRSSLLTKRARGKNRNLPIYSATSRPAEVYPYTGRKSILFVTNLICRSWKERNGSVGSFQVTKFCFLRPPRQLAATKKHLTDLVKQYGEQTLVNLVDHKGYERPVKEAYEKSFSQVETRTGTSHIVENLIFYDSSRFQRYSMSTSISTPSAGT